MTDQSRGRDAAAAARPPAGIPPTVIAKDPLHPGPEFALIPAALVQQLIDHARAEYPNEACGLIIGDRPASEGGVPLRFEPTRNVSASPYRYEIHADDLLRLTVATDDAGEAFWGIVHSHTHTPARPSPTDMGLAFYPEALYVLVSLSPDQADPSAALPSVRAWRIIDGDEFEVELRVTT